MGALYLDGGIELADRVFSRTCFPEEDLLDTWVNCPKHPLVADEPDGDRHWIEQSHVLQKLVQFEDDIGYEFRHIRLLARAFTQRNVGYNNLTYGHNQRLEFLGDTIMQLICTDYLFKHFPDHHEGHLTLLRSSLVNNKTQSTVATELGMPDFVIKVNMTKAEKPLTNIDLKTKEKADLLEALYGALYVDGGLEPCQILTDICFFPRLEDFIADQEWNDPKSQLQQCCLTLRDMNDDSPDIPIYKVIRKYGPTNLRKYMVAVYFREKRLAVGVAGSKQQAEMVAAETALKEYQGLFHRSVYPSRAKNKAVIAAFRKEFQHEKQLQSSDVDTAKN
ncbi:ribonuclease 3-like [Ruditapes philippinarum]|uniref:ribonuclease 3-like n=1 Tax=Ruditapes philippinarum TaxID=129788 RepID=UPI00295A9448|nr:ribonuclease 3-like [Ruditapes philippinarum]